MTDLVVQSLTLASGEYLFVDETSLSATDKGYLLGDWQRFVQQGFKKLLFTGNLYRFLTAECSFSARYNHEYFWAYYFNAEAIRLRAFLNQFGGNKVSAEFNTPTWLGGSAADLKQAMCDEVTFLQGPLAQVLDDLEFKHAEMGQVWREFALNSGRVCNSYLGLGCPG